MPSARPRRTLSLARALAVRTIAVGAIALSLGAPSRARAQTPTGVETFNPGAAITVTGTGEDQIAPDRARVSLGVVTQAATAAAAAQQNARLQQSVLDAVRAQGIPAEQISTSGYNVSPTTEYNQQTQRSRVTGYSVQNTVTVELRRIDQIGPVLDAVLAKGANTVSSLELYSSQAEASRRRALAKAVERARADAEAIAAAAGGRLGLLLDLSSAPSFGPPRAFPMAMARVATAPATPISEGLETNSASITARWQFVPLR